MEEPENSLGNSLGVRSHDPWGQKSHRRCQAYVLRITYPYSSSGIYSRRAREEAMFERVCCKAMGAAGFPGSYVEAMEKFKFQVLHLTVRSGSNGA